MRVPIGALRWFAAPGEQQPVDASEGGEKGGRDACERYNGKSDRADGLEHHVSTQIADPGFFVDRTSQVSGHPLDTFGLSFHMAPVVSERKDEQQCEGAKEDRDLCE
ncbi:hypothetical protein [Streptomyces canus]|uniref:hypothetical protein n=1 Tax=Streptomyces canus TaxID=58343 RepID=UPI003248DCCF